MTPEKILSENKTEILKKWFDLVLDSYPADTSNFLRKQKNPFSNPVGQTIYQGLEKILDELILGSDFEGVASFLDNIVRIRAVQDFTPSQAVSFVFSLKGVIREEVGKARQEGPSYEELLALESRIDSLALSAFDIFMKCREKLYDIKANELRNMTFRLLQRVNTIGENEGKKNVVAESNNDNSKEKEVTK